MKRLQAIVHDMERMEQFNIPMILHCNFRIPSEPEWYRATVSPPSLRSIVIHHPLSSLTTAIVNHVSRDEASMTKMEKGGGRGVVLWIVWREKRAAMVRSATICVHTEAAALCLIIFSVMVVDKNKGNERAMESTDTSFSLYVSDIDSKVLQ